MRFFFNLLAIACVFASLCFGAYLHSETNSSETESPTTTSHPHPFPFEETGTEPVKPKEDRFIFDFINMLASLGLIIAILLIATWILKRLLNTHLQQVNSSSNIKVLEKRALSPKTAIYIIEVNNRNLVLAESVNGITRLSEDYQEAGSSQQTFEQIVNQPSQETPS
jgi:flagellar biosynthetic protein FliO